MVASRARKKARARQRSEALSYESFNDFCAGLPATSHVVQWGGSHVWKVGGKVFAIGGWASQAPAFTFKVGDIELYEMLSALPGVRPAPYFASRGMKWVQHYSAPGLSNEQCLLVRVGGFLPLRTPVSQGSARH